MPRHPAASVTCVAIAVVSLVWSSVDTGCCAHKPAPAPSNAPAGNAPAPKVRAGASPSVEPTTAEACRACGGEWAPHGITATPSCLCPTADADKRCRDGAECEGQCLADAGDREVTAAGPPARGYFVGKCSRFRTSFGCHRFIDRGALKAGPVLLDEPPTEICAD